MMKATRTKNHYREDDNNDIRTIIMSSSWLLRLLVFVTGFWIMFFHTLVHYSSLFLQDKYHIPYRRNRRIHHYRSKNSSSDNNQFFRMMIQDKLGIIVPITSKDNNTSSNRNNGFVMIRSNHNHNIAGTKLIVGTSAESETNSVVMDNTNNMKQLESKFNNNQSRKQPISSSSSSSSSIDNITSTNATTKGYKTNFLPNSTNTTIIHTNLPRTLRNFIPRRSIIKPSYRISSLCSNCRYASATVTTTCLEQIGKVMEQLVANSSSSTSSSNNNNNNSSNINNNNNNSNTNDISIYKLENQAVTAVTEKFPNCYRCHPSMGCNYTKRENYYYRPDEVVHPYIQHEISHLLQSIDPIYRLPPPSALLMNIANITSNDSKSIPNLKDATIALTKYFASSDNIYPKKRYVFEFNPSIVVLPLSQRPANSTAVYLASYRISTIHACIVGPLKDRMNGIVNGTTPNQQKIDDVALALLDVNFAIVQENVFDVQNVFRRAQDYRLFNLNNQLYLSTNVFLAPIWIIPPPTNATTSNDTSNIIRLKDVDGQDWSGTFQEMTMPMSLSKVANRKHSTTNSNSSLVAYIRKVKSSTRDFESFKFGKNFNFFYDPTTKNVVMETFPMGPKEIFDPTIKFKTPTKPTNNTNDTSFVGRMIVPVPLNSRTISFATTDELEIASSRSGRLPYTPDRGGACCVRIQDPRNQTGISELLLGVSHTKSRDYSHVGLQKNVYFSSFYVMESVEPYNVVARTGRLCLGYPNISSPTTTYRNPYAFLRESWIQVGNEAYRDCPVIHFITGMLQQVDDPTKLIITYGINDCTSHLVVLDLQHILDLLFQPDALLE